MPDLKRYRQKRDPERTPEPFDAGGDARALAPNAPRVFVVQQHHARQLHWDLRLEIDGVLVSWAVPKGPTLDPGEKRFAARTEDHPLAYAEFEGIIPEGNYGAGAMIVWDSGTYTTWKGSPPREGLESGKLDLALRGHKLQGRFALVRMKGEDGKAWLLLRKGDPPAEDEEELVDRLPRSVFSGLTVGELKDGPATQAALEKELAGLPIAETPLSIKNLKPMLASSGDEPFSRKGWLFELKLDGARVLAQRRSDRVELRSRSGRDATHTYPEISRTLLHLPVDDFILDGEVVALDERGRTSFERIQRRFGRDAGGPRDEIETPAQYRPFDLLSLCGRDLRELPLRRRKKLLAMFVPALGRISYSDHVEVEGQALFDAASENGLEGVIAKNAESRYVTGKRTGHWLKFKADKTADLVIVGYQRGKGSRDRLGSLLVGWYLDRELVYAGRVGSGLSEAGIDGLLELLTEQVSDESSVEGGPEKLSGVVWTRPELVCEVRYTEVTSAGSLRHPVFLRLRHDKEPGECTAQVIRDSGAVAAPKTTPPSERFEPTNLDKVFWPGEGLTKGDLLAYYEAIWPWLAPYLRDRPVVLTRFPDGIEGKSFFQKNAPDFTPAWVERETLEGTDYFICNDLRTLLYVINSGAIPLHVWSARRDALDKPDWVILDLDPKEAPFSDVIRIARFIHQLLEELGAPHFAKTSGQDGLHVMIPLGQQLDHGQAKTLGEVLARVVVAELPDIATITRPVAARADRVYIDYLQNGRGKLIAAPFSVRPRPGAPCSTPLRWSQVTTRLDPTRWNMKTTPKAMVKSGDPMHELLELETDVAALLDALAVRL